MFDRIHVGALYKTYEHTGDLYAYSKVIITVSDDISYEAGTDTGRTLMLDCPWGTQQMAIDILSRVQGLQHRGYTATGVLLDPAAELGDALDINGNQSGLYSLRHKFGSLMVATIGSPGIEEINDEVPYKSVTERKIDRQYAETKATFSVQASQIAAEVSAREEQGRELRASLSIQADRITQEVSDRETQGEQFKAQFQVQSSQIAAKVSKTGGSSSSFGWELTDSAWTLKSNNTTVLKATKSGLEIQGTIRATGGKIGGFDIQSNYLSYNGQTWGGTNTTGIYMGPEGIQCGKYVKLTNRGILYAEAGYFNGTVQAGNIDYGGDAGYFSGSGLSGGSVYGAKIAGSTLSTAKFTSGVNASLGYADFANGVFNGYNRANAIACDQMSAGSILFDRRILGTSTITYKGVDDATHVINVVTWSWR